MDHSILSIANPLRISRQPLRRQESDSEAEEEKPCAPSPLPEIKVAPPKPVDKKQEQDSNEKYFEREEKVQVASSFYSNHTTPPPCKSDNNDGIPAAHKPSSSSFYSNNRTPEAQRPSSSSSFDSNNRTPEAQRPSSSSSSSSFYSNNGSPEAQRPSSFYSNYTTSPCNNNKYNYSSPMQPLFSQHKGGSYQSSSLNIPDRLKYFETPLQKFGRVSVEQNVSQEPSGNESAESKKNRSWLNIDETNIIKNYRRCKQTAPEFYNEELIERRDIKSIQLLLDTVQEERDFDNFKNTWEKKISLATGVVSILLGSFGIDGKELYEDVVQVLQQEDANLRLAFFESRARYTKPNDPSRQIIKMIGLAIVASSVRIWFSKKSQREKEAKTAAEIANDPNARFLAVGNKDSAKKFALPDMFDSVFGFAKSFMGLGPSQGNPLETALGMLNGNFVQPFIQRQQPQHHPKPQPKAIPTPWAQESAQIPIVQSQPQHKAIPTPWPREPAAAAAQIPIVQPQYKAVATPRPRQAPAAPVAKPIAKSVDDLEPPP